MVRMSDVLQRGGRKLQSAKDQPPPKTDPPAKSRTAQPPARPKPASAPKPQADPKPASQAPEANVEMDFELGPSQEEWSIVDNERLVSLFSPSSPQAKRIDILRSQLLYPFHGEPPRTIMITSAAPREGKSLLATNLAVSFARGLQQFVMVMDCNLMGPRIHELLQVVRRPGLTDYLEYGATVPEIIHWTKVDKLSVIPAGSPSHRSAEILATDRMAALLTELRARYADRYIILDTPPVQAFDDPAVLARMVEGIVFVTLAGDTDRDVVTRALGRLPEEKLIGMVLNDKLGAVFDAASISAPADSEG